MLPSSLRFPKAVLFDMDGTLTQDTIDYVAIRSDMGLDSTQPILEWLATLPPDHHAVAH